MLTTERHGRLVTARLDDLYAVTCAAPQLPAVDRGRLQSLVADGSRHEC